MQYFTLENVTFNKEILVTKGLGAITVDMSDSWVFSLEEH